MYHPLIFYITTLEKTSSFPITLIPTSRNGTETHNKRKGREIVPVKLNMKLLGRMEAISRAPNEINKYPSQRIWEP